MSSEYIDTILVECDRSSATIKQDDNPSAWTNKQNNTLQLLPNDKVSVYSSYINDVGSGQEAPIEFRGKRLGKTKQIQVINQVSQITQTRLTAQQETHVIYTTDELQTLDVDVKDNEANLVINFYKTMDANNYIQCPRRFIPETQKLLSAGYTGNVPEVFWAITDKVIYGRTHVEQPRVAVPPAGRIGESNYYGYQPHDMRGFLSYEEHAPPPDDTPPRYGEPVHFILKNDNTRYTIMKKLNNVNPNQPNLNFSTGDVRASYKQDPTYSHFPPYWARDPEYFDYKMVREHIVLKADVGFNAASSVADTLSKDLQATKENPREDFNAKRVSATATEPALKVVLNRTLNSKTYQQIDVGNEGLQSETFYKRALFNGPLANLADTTVPTDGVHLEQYHDPNLGQQAYRVTDATDRDAAYYYNGYRYIACKRPEIYEAGQELNTIFGIETIDQLDIGENYTHGLVIGIPYFETDTGELRGTILEPKRPSARLLKYKAFNESQALYPELWDELSITVMLKPDDNPYYTMGGQGVIQHVNINNSRYSHLNTFVTQNAAGDFKEVNNNIIYADRHRFVDPTDINSLPKNEFTQLGCSYYDYRGTSVKAGEATESFNRQLTDKSQSRPFFYHYDPDQKDEFYEEPVSQSDWSSENWSYGAFGLQNNVAMGGGEPPMDNCVVIYPSALTYNKTTKQLDRNVGLPPCYFHFTHFLTTVIMKGSKMGFDRHWNAWSNAMICLNSGKGQYGYSNTEILRNPNLEPIPQLNPCIAVDGLAPPNVIRPINYQTTLPVPTTTSELTATPALNTAFYNNKMYIGADSPKLEFDGKYFNFKDLHTALNKGNLVPIDPLVDTAYDPNEGGRIVYKINPSQEYEMYSPVQFPYNRNDLGVDYYLAGTTDKRRLIRMNFNLEPLTIYDTTTGIFIADWGYNEDSWNSGLWGRLGFSYNQFHSDTLSRTERINLNNVSDLNVVTTNASVDCVDTKSWSQNQYGVPKYDGSPLIASTINISESAHDGTNPPDDVIFQVRWIPPIYQTTESIKIQAQNYPISMFNGYYAIRSDIVGDSSFVDGTGNTAMPIVSVMSKQNPAGDFYITPEADISFTITKPTRISDISIEITEPDGTPAPISERSSVIFKIERIRKLNTDVAREVFDQFMEKQKKNKKSLYSPQ
tara:strand:+ start:3310 stop:6786 length:3477 start_codon:yes stop_codon:yes gene_type:complete